jgi:glycerophosphoryl diester phosphodiesterase
MFVVGHRGAAGVLPENTIKGFEYAIGLGVTYVECDVHLTSDKHLVVMHDATVDRTTNGTGAIRDLRFETIRNLDAGEGEHVPTFDEVLAVTKGKVTLLCELKGEGVEQAAVDAVERHGMGNEVMFSSFYMDRIQRVKQIDNNLAIRAIMTSPSKEDIQNAIGLGIVGLDVHYRNLTLQMIEDAHAAGVNIIAWNPNTWAEQKAMIGLGVDGVSSDRPDILMSHLQE